MWWMLLCTFACDVDAERTDDWRYEAAIERNWRDLAESPYFPAQSDIGYETREACLAALREAEPAGETPYTHWVGGEPTFRITVTHHDDWIELFNNANNVHQRFACFERRDG